MEPHWCEQKVDRAVIHSVAETSRNICVPPSLASGFSGVVSAVAALLALSVDVLPSGRLRLHGGPNTQADLTVAESWWSRVCKKETNVPTANAPRPGTNAYPPSPEDWFM